MPLPNPNALPTPPSNCHTPLHAGSLPRLEGVSPGLLTGQVTPMSELDGVHPQSVEGSDCSPSPVLVKSCDGRRLK